MKREHLAFLCGGFAFGVLFGFGLFHAYENRPDLSGERVAEAELEGPRGPRAMAQTGPSGVGPSGAAGGAPMMREINALKTALQQNPDDVVALVRLGSVYQQVGMWDQAAGFYERAVESGEERPELLLNLGLSYRALGRYEEALDLFERTHRNNPDHWQSLFNAVVVAAGDMQRIDDAFMSLESLEAIGRRETLPQGFEPARVRQLRTWLEGLREPTGQS